MCPGPLVIDAELTDRPVPTTLGRRFGAEGFWPRWTRAECAAKLSGTPIAIWLRRHGLHVPADFPGCFRSYQDGLVGHHLVVAVAWLHT